MDLKHELIKLNQRLKAAGSQPADLPFAQPVTRRAAVAGAAAVVAVHGDGLVRPMNAPEPQVPGPGVMAGLQNPNVIANRVIVFGPGASGVFVYSGTPARGNPPIAWMSNSGTDPYGNVLAPPVIGSIDNGSKLWSGLIDGSIEMGSQNPSTFIFLPAVVGVNDALSSSVSPLLALHSPSTTAPGGQVAAIQLAGQSNDLSQPSAVSLLASEIVVAFNNAPVNISTAHPGGPPGTLEGWQPSLTLPAAGVWTGTAQYALLPLAPGFAVLDLNLTFQTTLAAASYTFGSALPSAYQIPGTGVNRQWPIAVNQAWSTVANASPRVAIMSAGSVQMQMPAFVVAGQTAIVSATVMYPLR